jgi:hypothetical protein
VDPKQADHGPVVKNLSVLVAIVVAAIVTAAVPLAFCFFCGCCTVQKEAKLLADFSSSDSHTVDEQKALNRASARKSLDCSAVLALNGIPKSTGHGSEGDSFSLSSDYTDSASGSGRKP